MIERKFNALVIGNAAYPKGAALRNPEHDADDLTSCLERCGFSVIKVVNCTIEEMDRALQAFKKSLKGKDVGLFFFAGHGMQITGENYLNAIDTKFSDETGAKYSSLPLNRVIELMEKSGTSTNVVILDACRNNPFERAWRRSAEQQGLAPIYAPKGTLIAYATSPGEYASDGRGRNGAYTEAILRHIDTPDCSVEEMFKRVRNTLSTITKRKQTSWEHTSLSGEFFFNQSLGMRLGTYSRTALCDGLFTLDQAKSSHKLIKKLKSLTWPTQNPAVDSFSAEKAGRYSTDSLFVIGRNIYQAACGNSNSATKYIRNFPENTQALQGEKRKAILDGMLFETFFDPKGEPRKEFKLRRFNELFSLQQYAEFGESFEFISECLVMHANRFYLIPGKKHRLAVDVVSAPSRNNPRRIKGIYVGGRDILWMEDDAFARNPRRKEYRAITLESFEMKVSEEMVIPAHLLKITYDFKTERVEEIQFPRGFTLRKR